MPILTLTVNPALDVTTSVGTVESGSKLRCGTARFDPGGGGVNVSRAIAKLGGRSVPIVAAGGVTGDMVKSLLTAEGIDAVWFPIDGETRQSFAANETSTGKQFRFVLPGPLWSKTQSEKLLACFAESISDPERPISFAVMSGSLPPGVPDDLYQGLSVLAARAGAKFVLDTSGRALSAAAHEHDARPHVIIMDQAEAEYLAGRRLGSMDALEDQARRLQNNGLAEIAVLSYAEGGAVATSASECVRVMPPKVDVVSKVGAGDSFVAGLVLKMADGASLREACAYAVASAASAVTTPATDLLDGPLTEQLFSTILDTQG